MTDVAIQTINTSTPNSGQGDSIYAAFTKVNNNEANLVVAVNVIQNNYANTSYGVFSNLSVSNQVLGSLYFTGANTIYVNGSPVATSAGSFSGGDVPNQANFNAATSSTSSTTGAVRIPNGGLGVGGSIYAAGGIFSTATSDSSGTTTGSIVSSGGLGVALNTHIGQGLYVGTSATIGAQLTASTASITGTTVSSGVSTGALVVAGGVGIGGSLNVNNDATVGGNITVTGNVNILAGQLNAGTQTLVVSTNLINIHSYANAQPLTYDDGRDIGMVMEYYKAGIGDARAALVWANNTSDLEYYAYANVAPDGSVVDGPGSYYGKFKGSAFEAVNTTPSTSSITGALIVAGGAGIGGNINIAGSNGNAIVTTANVYAGNIIVSGISVNGGGINNVTIGQITPSSAAFTTVVATTLNAATIGNIGANHVGTGTYLTGLNANNIGSGIVSPTYGGTGVNNGSYTLTLQSSVNINQNLRTTDSPTFAGGTFNGTIVAAAVNAPTIGNTGAALTGNSVSTAYGSFSTSLTSTGTTTLGATTATGINSTPIGATTPESGTFTSLTATGSTALGATTIGAMSATSIDNTPIGSIAPDTGVFTTLTVSNSLVPTSNAAAVNLGSTGSWFNNIYGSTVYTQTLQAQTAQTSTLTVSTSLTPSSNASINLGSSGAWWNTIYGVASQAMYADLAENYLSDQEYPAGTVVVFGGTEEITQSLGFADARVAGVISTDPAYLMNGACGGLPVALRGRVPCMVVGPVSKGDSIVTDSANPGCGVSIGVITSYGQAVFAKSLVNDTNEGPRLVEVVIL